MSEKFEMIAKTFQGLEEVLAIELKNLGAENVVPGCRSVSFYGDKELLYRANFQLRTAIRILMPVYTFSAHTVDEFYGNAKKFDWSSLMTLNQKFAVDGVVNSQYFNHSRYVALKFKDALADQFREKFGKRPFVDPRNPQIQFHVHVNNDICTVSIDSSGESLHRRGYRVSQDIAPLNEVLAAGMIMIAGWNGDSDFLDPMCGSGTLLIEAALIAYGIAPGIFRSHFGFEDWLDFDPDLLEKIYNDDSLERDFEHSIIGIDISRQAVESALTNIKQAGLQRKVTVIHKSIFDHDPVFEGHGMVITNPPYGERLRKDQIETFYKQLGDTFKQRYNGCDVWMISSNFEALKNFGLRPAQRYNLFNGALECKYQNFQIYKGSLKTSKKKR
ncbi:MAG: class I SAM-dependent RNA methyltransferase [Bacteroidales bacterium]|nr:class I SAM-dependent RNA methyltransferase [Bacteroidales bacterium]HPD94558.1 class I SAM-dependent RNA methyltransferase [Tenuifilaceae bacterium]